MNSGEPQDKLIVSKISTMLYTDIICPSMSAWKATYKHPNGDCYSLVNKYICAVINSTSNVPCLTFSYGHCRINNNIFCKREAVTNAMKSLYKTPCMTAITDVKGYNQTF